MYEASNAGVRIDLIVRGICGLKAGCKGFSSNIKVRSIVGRLLEHSRIFYFENAGSPRYFIASADMMPRNLNRRVELMAEIKDVDFKNALDKFLDITLADLWGAKEIIPHMYDEKGVGEKVSEEKEVSAE